MINPIEAIFIYIYGGICYSKKGRQRIILVNSMMLAYSLAVFLDPLISPYLRLIGIYCPSNLLSSFIINGFVVFYFLFGFLISSITKAIFGCNFLEMKEVIKWK